METKSYFYVTVQLINQLTKHTFEAYNTRIREIDKDKHYCIKRCRLKLE